MTVFNTPSLEYGALLPILIVFIGAVIGVLVEAFVKPSMRRFVHSLLTPAILVVALFQVIANRDTITTTAAIGSVVIDGPVIIAQGSLLLLSLLALIFLLDVDSFAPEASALPGSEEEKRAIAAGKQQTEIFPLMLFSVSGMMLFPAASDLITLFVALEVLSLPLYLMAGLSRRRRLFSQESALKYFLLGAYSSAFFIFGAAFLYGYAGSITFPEIRNAVIASAGNDVILLIGIIFVSVGLLFKVGAVPFHAWTPDVYQGAPTPITGFMAAATKVAAFLATLRIFYTVLDGAIWQWQPILTGVAIITMAFGSIVAISQRDVKRMLAYSSIAHAGFLLAGVVAFNKEGLESSLFYLFAYGVATLGAFGIVTLIRDGQGEVTDLNRWAGLGKKSPAMASLFALFLLAFAGIPLTSGFIGKFSIFSAAYQGGLQSVVIVGVLSSAIAAFFYIRVIVLMFFTDASDSSVSVTLPTRRSSIGVWSAAIVTVALGVLPTSTLAFITDLAIFAR
jgi:NADH-quinone oxidoreductase subunit N